jgi:hypothetical protein
VIDVSLEALQAVPSLHPRFREGGNAIIFNANDFASPSSSEVFGILRGMPALRESAEKLAAICEAPVSSVPTLEDFRAGRNIPTATPVTSSKTKPTPPSVYIGAFPVLDGKDFVGVLRRVGDKVELVGEIVSVKQGVGKRGRGRGLPYVFINFGPWNGESVKITIWSEGLGKMSTRPSDCWVGKWISVTGLIEPPYDGKHYGRLYRNVGITAVSDSQIIQITERDAKFRLGRGGSVQQGATKPRNAVILERIQGGAGPASPPPPKAPPRAPPTPSPAVRSRNAKILEGIRPSPQPSTATYRYNPPPARAPQPSLLSRIPVWVWIILAIAIVSIIAR